MRAEQTLSQALETAARQLQNMRVDLPEEILARLLDNFPDDKKIVGAIVARPHLPPTIVLRLLDILDPSQRTRLLERHPLPSGATVEIDKRDRARPTWWTRHLISMFR